MTKLRLWFLCFASAAVVASAAQPAEGVKSYPLRGVVTAVLAEKSAIMVKHEEIPGVMRAMTMMFKVDAPTLKQLQKDQAITGKLSREGDEWWLRDVKVAAASKR